MQLIENFTTFIINPLIVLLFAVALMVFVWGVIEYIAKADSEEGRTTGRRHILWGLIGLAIMTAVRGILIFLQNTIGTTPGT